MYPNLLGQKAYHGMSNDDMAKIIHVSRRTYEHKMQTGKFTLEEGRAYCTYFNKTFDFLFAIDESHMPKLKQKDRPA